MKSFVGIDPVDEHGGLCVDPRVPRRPAAVTPGSGAAVDAAAGQGAALQSEERDSFLIFYEPC